MRKDLITKVVTGFVLIFILSHGNLSGQSAPQYYNSNLGTGNNSMPLNSATANKMQWLYGPGLFKTAGSTGTIAPPGLISDIFFRLGSTTSTSLYNNFTIKISQNVGIITVWSDPLFVTGMDTAFYLPVYSLVNPQPNQWHHIPLQNLIPYNPLLSLVVEICVSSGTGNTLLQPIFGASIHQNRYGQYFAISGTTSPIVIDFGINISQGTTDAGLESFVNLSDTMCDGTLPVIVKLKNHGQSVLNSAVIHWKVNNIAQPPYNWTGNLTSNATTNVTIGSYPFLHTGSYQIIAYSSNPNNIADTINYNDTIIKPEVHFKPSPGIVMDSTKAICAGDSAVIVTILKGTAPWNLTVSDGTGSINYNNLIDSAFSFSVMPLSTTTYSVPYIEDSTGCISTGNPQITVSVHSAPQALITPSGSTAVCDGDSVTLMGTIGPGYTYQWYLNGILLTSATSYAFHAKQGGDYTLKVTSTIGCSNLSAPLQIIIHPSPPVDLGNDTVLYPNQNIWLDAGPGFNTYSWSTGATTQTINVDSSGTGIGLKTIWVRVTDNYLCAGSDTIKINFTQHPGIAEASSEGSLRIIPNPSDGMIRLHLKGYTAGEYLVEVFSQDGRVGYKTTHSITPGSENIDLDLKHFAEGVYLIKVTGNEGFETGRIAIRR